MGEVLKIPTNTDFIGNLAVPMSWFSIARIEILLFTEAFNGLTVPLHYASHTIREPTFTDYP